MDSCPARAFSPSSEMECSTSAKPHRMDMMIMVTMFRDCSCLSRSHRGCSGSHQCIEIKMDRRLAHRNSNAQQQKPYRLIAMSSHCDEAGEVLNLSQHPTGYHDLCHELIHTNRSSTFERQILAISKNWYDKTFGCGHCHCNICIVEEHLHVARDHRHY